MSLQKEKEEEAATQTWRVTVISQSYQSPERRSTHTNLKSDYANTRSLPIFISVYRCWSECLGMTEGCQYSAS